MSVSRRFAAWALAAFMAATLGLAHFHRPETVHFNPPVNVKIGDAYTVEQP